jgi:hypothetical protein
MDENWGYHGVPLFQETSETGCWKRRGNEGSEKTNHIKPLTQQFKRNSQQKNKQTNKQTDKQTNKQMNK